MKILVFIPMYNCAKQITRVIDKIDASVRPYIAEVLIVDNGSTDGGREIAIEALKASGLPGKVVQNAQNYSLGGSHKVAFNYALDHGFDQVVVLHGDDQADIRDFLPVFQSGLYKDYDSVLGSRFMRGSTLIGYSLFRTVANYGFNFVCTILGGRAMSDQGSGLNMYSARYLASRFYLPFDNSLMFPNQMFFYGVHSGSKYKFMPITWREEDQRSNAKMFQQAYKVIKLVLTRKKVFAVRENDFSRIDYRFNVQYQQG